MRNASIALFLALGCNHVAATTDAAPGTDVGPGPPDLASPIDADVSDGGCSVEESMPPLETGVHVPVCSAVTHGSKPPSSGQHYPSWPLFRIYDKPVPWGFLVHGLEHGAVVIVHNCPAGCPAELAELKAMVEATPTKPGCSRPPVIVSPDPTLDVPFAASAWGYTLRASCFDRARFADFIQRRVNKGPENIPSDCGALDREATGWCP
jgi:hypothetical protein